MMRFRKCVVVTVIILLLYAIHYFSPWGNKCLKPEMVSFPIIHQNPSRWWELFPQHKLQEMKMVAPLLGSDKRQLIMLTVFQNILTFLGVRGFVIQPAVLFSTLDSFNRSLLEKRKFNISDFKGSEDVLTYGMFEDDIQRLQSDFSMNKLEEAGFQPFFVRKPITDWMAVKKNALKQFTYICHAFLMHFGLTIHIVVFYERNNYLWHGALRSKMDLLPKRNWLFMNDEGAFEKFSYVPYKLEMHYALVPGFYIPSEPQMFLFQMTSSRFLECSVKESTNSSYQAEISQMTNITLPYVFQIKTVSAIRNLKKLMHPLLMNVFIFCGTLLGWYRNCDIIPYTNDVDFAGWADEIEDIALIIEKGNNNEDFPLILRMGLPEEALELRFSANSLMVDLFFHYKCPNGSWFAGHMVEEGYYFRYYYPHFTLCSADLLGEKVLVPCETEAVIRNEYGYEWRTPVSNWSWFSSSENTGPHIYWDEKRRNLSYQFF